MFQALFRNAYLSALGEHHAHYDDLDEYGSAARARTVFYFVPGINGTPGQIRSLVHRYGPDIHIKCLNLPAFSSRRPIWEKYLPHHIAERQSQLRADLQALTAAHPKVYAIVSSNGFYDFAAAVGDLPAATRDRLRVLWISCAPDFFHESRWIDVFARISGFEYEGALWAAVPNHNWLRAFNPETVSELAWRDGNVRRRLYKTDLESRFRLAGMHWAFTSPDCFNRMLQGMIARISAPLTMPTYALYGTRDGYWYGHPPDAVERILHRYTTRFELLKRPASHLWVIAPDNLDAYLAMVQRGEGDVCANGQTAEESRPQISIAP
jgi:hypothetical protein